MGEEGQRGTPWPQRLWRNLPALCLLLAFVLAAIAFLLGPDPGL